MPVKDKIEHNETNQIKGDLWFGKFKKKYVIVTSIIIVLILILLIYLIVRLSTASKSNEVVDTSINATTLLEEQETTDQTSGLNLNQHIKFVSRRAWLAQPPTGTLNKLQLPADYVLIMDTDTDQCTNQTDCILAVRHIQTFHIESNKMLDISYNFLIGGDGFVYEGRGWKSEGDLPRCIRVCNPKTIQIAFIGTYETVLPTQADMAACKELIQLGVENGLIAEDYKMLGARQISGTKSPGLMLFEEIQDWPHWWFPFEY